MKITENLDTAEVRRRIGVGRSQELRGSARRRRYLQKLSRVLTPTRPSVRFDPNHPTAQVNQEANEPLIDITTREFDQPTTNLADDVFDMTIQEALLVHELGHILYTDHAEFKRTLSRVDLQYKAAFKRLWNVLEDGAIEKQLRAKFNVEDELFVLNANLMESGGDKMDVDADEGQEVHDGQSAKLGLYQAVHLGLMDMAVYDSGNFAKLLDDTDTSFRMRDPADRQILDQVLPIMEEVVEDVLTEPNGAQRTERIYDFWTDLKPFLDRANEGDGQQQQGQDGDGDGDDSDDGDQQGDQQQGLGDLFGDSNQSDGDDGDDDGQQGGQAAPIPGKPDDTDNADMGGAQDARELDRADEDDVQDQIEQAQESTESEMDASEPPTSDNAGAHGTGDKDDVDDPDDQTNGPDSGPDLDELEERRRDELRQEANEVDGADQMIEEMERYSQIMAAGGGDIDNITMDVPERTDRFDRDRWQDAKRRSKRPKKVLKSHLRQERRARTVKNQRRGRFDSSSIVDASRGSPRVFEREEEGDEKEYEVMFVLDRSYSMNGPRMKAAEEALAELAIALEELGVKVSIVDMHNNEARLISPLDAEIERDKEKVITDECAGGTPLSDAIALSRERMGQSDDEPFMIVVTDGQPDDDDAYMEELDRCNFPVLGVYVNEGYTEQEFMDLGHQEFFHRQVLANDFDALTEDLTQLCREVMI